MYKPQEEMRVPRGDWGRRFREWEITGTKSRDGAEMSYLRKQLEGQCGWSRGSWRKLLGDVGKEVAEGDIV